MITSYPVAASAVRGELVLDITLPGISSYDINAAGEYQVIQNEDMSDLYIPGKPLLPAKKYLVVLPPGSIADGVEVLRQEEEELPGPFRIKPAPALRLLMPGKSDSHEESAREWQKNYESTYRSDKAYPEVAGSLAAKGTLRKYSYASVSVCPFNYHPESGGLSYFNSARIKVHYRLSQEESQAAHRIEDLTRDHLADERAAELFVNFDQMKKLYAPAQSAYGIERKTYDYIILTDESLAGFVTSSDFYQWKIDSGNAILVVLNTDPIITEQPGRDLAEQIRNCLRANYLTWGVEHLLIVGDYETIPMRYCFPDPDDHYFNISDPYTYVGEVPTDYYYADLSYSDELSWDSDGDGYYGEYGQDDPDFLADIYVGRIPTSQSSRVVYTLNKLAAFGQDTRAWKNSALQPGAILFFENQNYGGYPFCDGARLLDRIESDLLSGWTISRYSEQSGLRLSDYDWPAISEVAFTSRWRNGRYSIVNWSGHGGPQGVGRTIWEWDDGDGVAESHELSSPYLISVDSNLDDDYPSIMFAVSCLVGYPEPTQYGNLGVDLLTKPSFGASAGVLSATRPAAISGDWPADPGGAESLSYEFNRHMISGPSGSQMLGTALYDSKFYSNQNYGWDHIYEYMNLFNYNLYGDPSMLREGADRPLVDDADAEFIALSGVWQEGNHPSAYEGSCAFSRAGVGDNLAAWRVDPVVRPGKYNIYVWKFEHAFSDLMATNARYRVRDNDNLSDWVFIDQSTPGNEWVFLGSFSFDNSRAQGIEISDEADGYVVADAVKLVYTGSMPQP